MHAPLQCPTRSKPECGTLCAHHGEAAPALDTTSDTPLDTTLEGALEGATAPQPRKGIVVIHGIGASVQSSTLLDAGQPLLLFVKKWLEAQGRMVRFGDGDLAFGTVDDGGSDVKPHVAIVAEPGPQGEPGLAWVMAEAWWAQSFRQPGFPVMVGWAWRHWWSVLTHLCGVILVRTERLASRNEHSSDPGFLARTVDAVNNTLLLVLVLATFPLGVILFGVLFAAAQIPIKQVQEFIVLGVLEKFLVVNIAQFRAFLEDETQAANMRRRLESTLAFLAQERDCTELYIIAHSGGVPIVFDALSHPEQPQVTARVRKVFSIGEGLNKAWEIDPTEPRIHGPLAHPARWVDFWASYDPVPTGPIAATRYAVKWPSDFESNEVTHRMDVLTDHGGYWLNGEQVLWSIAQEVETAD